MVTSRKTKINKLIISNAATTITKNHLSFLGRWVLEENHNEQTHHLDWNNSTSSRRE